MVNPSLVHVLRDLVIVLLVDQQRLRETVQHTFDGASPFSVGGLYFQQFPCKRKVVLFDVNGLGQRFSSCQQH